VGCAESSRDPFLNSTPEPWLLSLPKQPKDAKEKKEGICLIDEG